MGKSVWVWSILSKGILHVCENVCIHSASLLYGLLLRAIFTKTRARTIMIEKRFWERTCRADYQSPQSIFMDWPNHVQYCNFTNFLYVRWSMVLPKLKKTPKWQKYIERSRQHPRTPKFKRNQMLRDHPSPKICKNDSTRWQPSKWSPRGCNTWVNRSPRILSRLIQSCLLRGMRLTFLTQSNSAWHIIRLCFRACVLVS